MLAHNTNRSLSRFSDLPRSCKVLELLFSCSILFEVFGYYIFVTGEIYRLLRRSSRGVFNLDSKSTGWPFDLD